MVTQAQGAVPNASAHVFSYNGFVKVTGSWKRIDEGGSLVPGTVTIECRQDSGQCLEASTMVSKEYVYAPELSWFDATFAPDSVSYVNDLPDCAIYSVRIDLTMKKAFAVRQKKERVTDSTCALLEDRIEMQIADGYDTHTAEHDPFEESFVPILSLIRAFAK